jgi:hypothetical protein
VKLRAKIVEIFSEGAEAIAIHPRLFGFDRASTLDAHYPDEKIACARFEVKSALNLARKVGPETQTLVENLVKGTHPLKHLRRIQGILRLHLCGAVRKESLEYACNQAMRFNKTQFHYIKQAALFFENGGTRPRIVPPIREERDLYLHQTHEENP